MKRILFLIPLLLACGPFFYQAPPALAKYPERTPGKTWQDLLDDAQPGTGTNIQLLHEKIRKFGETLDDLGKGQALEATQTLIEENRRGEFDIASANFLLELKELLQLDLPAQTRTDYLNWRIQNFPPPNPPYAPQRNWQMPVEEFRKRQGAHRKKLFTFLTSHEERVAAASPEIKPFEIIQQGGMLFRAGYLDLAEANFKRVIREFPEHPRAEVARFMLARTHLGQLRNLHRGEFETAVAFQNKKRASEKTTRASFQDYLDHHPEGRFANDSIGWLGGLARDKGDQRTALNLQLTRLKTRPTREVTASVLRECNEIFLECFEELSIRTTRAPFSGTDYPFDFDFEQLAGTPLVARLFVAHCIEPALRTLRATPHIPYRSDRSYLDFLHRRIIAPGPAITRALSQLGQAAVKNDSPPDATSLLILGWASTRSGDHEQAFSLFELGLKLEETDELLHGRAIALSRLDRHGEAAATFERLFTTFPQSPLVHPSRFDLALAHLFSNSAGKAFVILHEDHLSNSKPRHPLYTGNERLQWMDTILQFSPLAELHPLLETLPPDHPAFAIIKRAVILRATCDENFQVATALLPEGKAREHLVRLIEAHQQLAASQSDSERARLHLAIGRLWKSARGQLTLPLRDLSGPDHSQRELRDQIRRENALLLGLSREDIDQATIARDELSHALVHFQKAADLTSEPSIAAPALEGTNESLFRMAEISPFFASIAARDNHSERSRRLVDRLKQEFPGSPEAERAIPFTFLPAALLGRWMPGDFVPWKAEEKIAEVFEHQDRKSEREAQLLLKNLRTLALGAENLETIEARLSEAERKFQSLRPGLTPRTLIIVGGHLQDFRSLMGHPGITPDHFQTYVPIRLSDNAPNLNEEISPLAPFIDFLNFRKEPNPTVHWTNYLARYPKGPKSEAASLRLLRPRFRRAFPLPKVKPFHLPDAPQAEGYKTLRIPGPYMDLVVAEKMLQDHRRKFPESAFPADLGLLEAALLSSQKKHAAALNILTEILGDPNHPELIQDASLQFSELALRLVSLKDRASLVSAFQNNPEALALLRKLAHGETCLSRLRPMLNALARP